MCVPRPAPALGASAKAQEVANPGLHRQKSIAAAQKKADLKASVDKLAAQVAALELKIAAAQESDNGVIATSEEVSTMADLVKSLKALTETADGEAPLTSSRVIGAGGRPTTAPYRSLPTDSQSMVSWSADAFGKSKTPGWYHQHRKQIFAQRAARAAAQPKGYYVSHSKYADEAVRSHRPFTAGKLQ